MARKLNPEHVQAVIDLINTGPYFQLLSMVVRDIGPGYSLVETTMEKSILIRSEVFTAASILR